MPSTFLLDHHFFWATPCQTPPRPPGLATRPQVLATVDWTSDFFPMDDGELYSQLTRSSRLFIYIYIYMVVNGD